MFKKFISQILILSMILITSCTAQSELNSGIQPNTSSPDKDTEKLMVYNTLTANTGVLNADDVLGLVLLDLDFDGTPELLVSKKVIVEKSDAYICEGADVDVYRVRDNQLAYIDTIHNYKTLKYWQANVLGLKTLESGNKAWFNMSYKNRADGRISETEYLFTLNGDKLEFTELFSTIKDNWGTDSFVTDNEYYYMGEKMEFEYFLDDKPATKEEADNAEDWLGEENAIIPSYKWGEYTGNYGEWEIFGWLKQDYCKDMENSTVNLYSERLFANINEYYEESTKAELSDEEFKDFIKNITDSYYQGENAMNTPHEYGFLGEYA